MYVRTYIIRKLISDTNRSLALRTFMFFDKLYLLNFFELTQDEPAKSDHFIVLYFANLFCQQHFNSQICQIGRNLPLMVTLAPYDFANY